LGLVSHFLKHADTCGEGNAPGIEFALHLVSHSILFRDAVDASPPRPALPLEIADVEVKALAIAMAIAIARNLAFIVKSPCRRPGTQPDPEFNVPFQVKYSARNAAFAGNVGAVAMQW
jgi:hypothetical protein